MVKSNVTHLTLVVKLNISFFKNDFLSLKSRQRWIDDPQTETILCFVLGFAFKICCLFFCLHFGHFTTQIKAK